MSKNKTVTCKHACTLEVRARALFLVRRPYGVHRGIAIGGRGAAQNFTFHAALLAFCMQGSSTTEPYGLATSRPENRTRSSVTHGFRDLWSSTTAIFSRNVHARIATYRPPLEPQL